MQERQETQDALVQVAFSRARCNAAALYGRRGRRRLDEEATSSPFERAPPLALTAPFRLRWLRSAGRRAPPTASSLRPSGLERWHAGATSV
jgi:hypothetical protein